MHIAIAAISVPADSILKIANYRKRRAGVTRQVLSQTESRRSCPVSALIMRQDKSFALSSYSE
jgi:hypothetical protein